MNKGSKYNLLYVLLKSWVYLGLRIYFRTIEVHGRENIPKQGPVIFAVNHPNTVLDALLTACSNNRKPWFMARGDVFRSPALRRIFKFMRMFPVYRSRDGHRNIKQNLEIFSSCAKLLAEGEAITLFPEGSHNRDWRIRPLGKALPRIVFESLSKGQEIWVVPVGLTYFDPSYPLSDVLIQYGQAIKCSDYAQYNQTEAFEKLNQRVFDSLCELTLHIDTNYDRVYRNIKILERGREECDLLIDDFKAIKANIELCSGGFQAEEQENNTLRKIKLGPLLALLVTSPLWLYGKIFTAIPQLGIFLINRKIADHHFHASVRFGLGLISYTLLFFLSGIYFYQQYITWFWFGATWLFTMSSWFFVMLWEEHYQQLFGQRFMKD